MADVELVDQKKYLEDSSKPKCVRPLIEYQCSCRKCIHEHSNVNKLMITEQKWIRNICDVCHGLEACMKRVEGDETREKHCTGQYFDYWYCIDRTVAPKLFDKLK